MFEAVGHCLNQSKLPQTNLARTVACLALAGASEPRHLAAAEERKHPFHKTVITTDAHAACIGAFGERDGGIIVAGTGTVGWSIVNGQTYRVGGWGLPLSDEGSGAWLGGEALRRVLWAWDGRISWTPLLRALFAHFDNDPHAIVDWSAAASPRDFGSLRRRSPTTLQAQRRSDRTHAACRRPYRCACGAAHRQWRHAFGVGRWLCASLRPWFAAKTLSHLVEPEGDALDGACGSPVPPRHRWRGLLDDADRRWHGRRIARGRRGGAAADTNTSEPLSALARRLIRQRPRVIVTCARGSSAHAATFANTCLSGICGPVAFAALSRQRLSSLADLRDQMLLVISQSGRSDDLIETAAMARAAGAITAAIVNDLTSPLARTAESCCRLPPARN